jgi:hypothetical protein
METRLQRFYDKGRAHTCANSHIFGIMYFLVGHGMSLLGPFLGLASHGPHKYSLIGPIPNGYNIYIYIYT